MPLSNLARFFVALVPPEPILSEIRELKEEVARRFESSKALQSPPHITLVSPFETNLGEAYLASKLEAFARQEVSFEVVLDGFGCFPNRRFPVLYVKPLPGERMQMVQAAIEESLFVDQIITAKATMPFVPHITIGYRDLKPSRFKEAWPEFAARSYSTTFEAKGLFLLKWNFYLNKWDILQEHLFGATQLPLLS